jgi:deazaflavin-dependent oxidoreductase (nitroreductase family)
MLEYKPQAEKNAFDKAMQAFAQTKVGGKLFITVFPEIDRRLMPLTRGRISTGLGAPVVLLHVRGAKSGIERTVPLLATKHGDMLILIASKAGAVRHPAWFHNIKANPDVEVAVQGRDRVPMRATIAEGAERDRLWALAVDNYNGYERYQVRAGDRTIPVVALLPRSDG